MSANPEGWSYEAPAPEVGWFTGYWIHEDCPQADEQETTEEVVAVRKSGDTRITTHEMTCSCGASMQVEDEDYDPDEMPEEAFREEEALAMADSREFERHVKEALAVANSHSDPKVEGEGFQNA